MTIRGSFGLPQPTPRYKVSPNPVVGISSITAINYDLTGGTISSNEPDTDLGGSASVAIWNGSSVPQTETTTLTASTSRTSSWSDSLKVNISTRQTSFKCDVPLFAEGKIQVTATASNTYTWGGSETVADTYQTTCPVTVPQNDGVQVNMFATRSSINVPYTVNATLHLAYGSTSESSSGMGSYTGVYTGVNSHDFNYDFEPYTKSSPN